MIDSRLVWVMALCSHPTGHSLSQSWSITHSVLPYSFTYMSERSLTGRAFPRPGLPCKDVDYLSVRSHDDVIKWNHFPHYWPFVRSFDVFFDLLPKKRLSKQSWGWWFETPSRSLWRHHTGMCLHRLLLSWYGCTISLQSGPRLNIKTVLSTYGDFHVKDKTAVRTSYL